ncbi:MAG TPA: D-alanyl-D-alanine carboxypeptidase/D-alanyl-D-alanine-endopeptidase [Thermoanaerobaculia bacterium]|nr:D-alanyl-D-alanine carboxypeptidase/D-alanyl-D-alanine-endopeptidase [Thermoanaerobaculia bacterium]
MMARSPKIIAKLLLILSILLLNPIVAESAARRRRSKSRRRPAPQVFETAVGNTLQERLASLANGKVAGSAEVSIQVVDVDSGAVMVERNPHSPLAPASNMKLFTTAAALDLLKPGFEVATTIYMRGQVDPTGTLNGDVKIVGHGDPTIGGRFHDGHSTAVIEEWASDLKRAGVKTVHGNLLFEYGYMDTEYVHPSWPVGQLANWYEAPISAFSMQEGCVEVRVLPGRTRKPCVVQLEPPTSFVSIENNCTTGRGLPFVTRQRGTNTVMVRGGVKARSGASELFVTIENPIQYFASVTHETFERSGLHVEGQLMMTPHDTRPDWRPVTQHATPLNVIVDVINKKSQNHYAEELIKILGAETKKEGSWNAGTTAVKEWLTGKLGVPPGEFSPADGSGMSRLNRASSSAFISVLRYMWKSPDRRDFVSSLPFSGDLESKFGHRLNSEPYARQVYAKTGYIAGVVGLSGYVHGQSGKVYAFSFLFNNYHVGVYAVHHVQDEMLKEIVKNG